MEGKGLKEQQTPRSLPPSPTKDPWLVYFHGRREHNQTFYSLSEKRYYVKNIPQMRRKLICTCSHGWLVLLDSRLDSNECCLLNPVSMEKIQLPEWDNFNVRFCVLSSSPTDTNCIVLFIGCIEENHVPFIFCRPGDDDAWVKQELELYDDEISDVTHCAGKIYVLTKQGKLFNINIDCDNFPNLKPVEGVEEVPRPLPSEFLRNQFVLVESQGELFVVKMMYCPNCFSPDNDEVEDIEVFRMDFDRKLWERVDNLSDRAFFIGASTTTSCLVNYSKIKGDTIYFTSFEDRTLYAFNLEDKSVTITLPCPNVVNHNCQPNWILPHNSE